MTPDLTDDVEVGPGPVLGRVSAVLLNPAIVGWLVILLPLLAWAFALWRRGSLDEARTYLEQVQGRLTNKSTVRLEESDDATYTLHELAEEYAVDLVVLGAHGYSGSPKWPYGSVTTSFITYSSKPLLIVQDIAPSEIEPTPAQRAARQKAGH